MSRVGLTVFVSGEGTNLKALISAIVNNILPCKIDHVISNKDCSAVFLARDNNIKTNVLHWNSKLESREEYDAKLVSLVKNVTKNTDNHIIVLAGWMHILSETFTSKFPNILNLHPALPGQFDGSPDAINDAFKLYQEGKRDGFGIMTHRVTKNVDQGELISSMHVDTLPDQLSSDEFRASLRLYEKGCLIQGVLNLINIMNIKRIEKLQSQDPIDINPYFGKVRTVRDMGNGELLLTASDKLSAFNKHRCIVPGKGKYLNYMSEWWLKKTRHIIDNHLLWSNGKHMVVRKTKRVPLEIVVRGYLTGSSKTSIWKMYEQGKRRMYDIDFPDGMKQHQKLDKPILTPTTKDDDDLPITPAEIIKQKLLTQDEWDYISSVALKLFEYGSKISDKMGLCLVDTKYEFGWVDDKIILIDEVHTCDSSRYWIKQNLPYSESPPKKIDKDMVRDWLSTNCEDVYKDDIEIPQPVINEVSQAYLTYVFKLCEIDNKDAFKLVDDHITDSWSHYEVRDEYNTFHCKNRVHIISGSITDKPFVTKIQSELNKRGIRNVYTACSAHKNTQEAIDLIKKTDDSGKFMVWVTVAGRSNALSGVVAANSRYPVIACPPFKDKDDMMVNINSTLQMPSKVPVMTILEPGNVALAIEKIFQRD